MAYQLALPSQLAQVHDVFHVSMLHKYIADPSHVIDFHPLVVEDDVTYVELLACILDSKEKVLHSRTIPYVNIQWQRYSPEEAT